MSFLETIENLEDQRLSTVLYLLRAKQKGHNIYCLGRGVQASLLQVFYSSFGGKFDGYCVSDEYFNKDMRDEQGRPVKTLSSVESDKNAEILIGFQNYEVARKLLHKTNVRCHFHYIDDPYYFYKMDFTWVLEQAENLEHTYNLLRDDFSKKVMTAFIRTRLSGNPEEIYNLRSSDDEDYDYKLLKTTNHEVFVDVGAFTGDSIGHFLNYTGNEYKQIYAFEPDIENFKKMQKNLASYNVKYINKGAWDEKTTLRFQANNSSNSSVNENCENGISIETTTIDEELADIPVSFIKMDVEGAEMHALKGAQRTIQKCIPKLAICVYHRREDLIEIPHYIDSLFENSPYQYYLRHHSSSLCETVFYAVPNL